MPGVFYHSTGFAEKDYRGRYEQDKFQPFSAKSVEFQLILNKYFKILQNSTVFITFSLNFSEIFIRTEFYFDLMF